MKVSSERLMGVVGTGAIGAGVAQAAATAGFNVAMIDTDPVQVERALAEVAENLNGRVARGELPKHERDAILPRLKAAKGYGDFKGAECIVEAATEDLDTKRAIFSELIPLVSPRTLLATTTGLLSVSKIANGHDRADRFLGMRFYHPVPEMQVVELVSGEKTSDQALVDARAVCAKLDRTAVKVKDCPGCIGHRVSRPFFLEALRMLEAGEADVATIDAAVKTVGGFEAGPFETLDEIGLDIDMTVTQAVYAGFDKAERFKPSALEQTLIDAGHLGRKTGRGFYDYAQATPKVACEVPGKAPAWKASPALAAFAEAMDKPTDRAMWIYARILLAVVNEGGLVAETIALPRDVNLTMEMGFHYPEGPLMTADLIGLDLVQALMKDFYAESGQAERYQANPLLDRRVKEGHLGEKSARGFLYHALFERGWSIARRGWRFVGRRMNAASVPRRADMAVVMKSSSRATNGGGGPRRRSSRGRWSAAVIVCLVVGAMAIGCGDRGVPRLLDTASPDESLAVGELDWSDWGLILSRGVEGDKVDYERLLEDPAPLDRCMAMLSRVGPRLAPERFSTAADRLAYALNAYNATIVKSILNLSQEGHPPQDLPAGLERRFRFRVDGRGQTPAELRRMVETLAAGDWRVRFALCNGRRGGPPLYRRVFLPDMLDAQLNEVVRTALVAPQIVMIDHGEYKQLCLWRGLYAIREQLVSDYERRLQTADATILNVLLEWSDASRRMTLNSAVGYDVVALPYDGRTNSVDPPLPQERRTLFSILDDIKRLMP